MLGSRVDSLDAATLAVVDVDEKVGFWPRVTVAVVGPRVVVEAEERGRQKQ